MFLLVDPQKLIMEQHDKFQFLDNVIDNIIFILEKFCSIELYWII